MVATFGFAQDEQDDFAPWELDTREMLNVLLFSESWNNWNLTVNYCQMTGITFPLDSVLAGLDNGLQTKDYSSTKRTDLDDVIELIDLTSPSYEDGIKIVMHPLIDDPIFLHNLWNSYDTLSNGQIDLPVEQVANLTVGLATKDCVEAVAFLKRNRSLIEENISTFYMVGYDPLHLIDEEAYRTARRRMGFRRYWWKNSVNSNREAFFYCLQDQIMLAALKLVIARREVEYGVR